MDSFQRLRQAVETSQRENDLPDFLAERLLLISSSPDRYGLLETEVADLAYQVEQYDTYAQTGYMGMGVNNAILEGAIRRIEAKALPAP